MIGVRGKHDSRASLDQGRRRQWFNTTASQATDLCVVTSEDLGRYEAQALQRAREALRCLPFRLSFYQELQHGTLSSTQMAARSNRAQLSRSPLGPRQAEDHFIWLIALGVLRREVDGQGLTERVRLTPLGREVLASLGEELPPASPLLRLRHWLRRHRPRL